MLVLNSAIPNMFRPCQKKKLMRLFFLVRYPVFPKFPMFLESHGQQTSSAGSRKVTCFLAFRSHLLCERRLSLMKYIYVVSAPSVKCMLMATNPGSLRMSTHSPVSSALRAHLFVVFSSLANTPLNLFHLMICAIIFANVKDQSGAHSGTMRVMCCVATSRRPAECLGGALVPRLPSLKSVFSLRSVTNLSPRPTGWQARGKDQCRPRADGRQAPAACRHTELELQ